MYCSEIVNNRSSKHFSYFTYFYVYDNFYLDIYCFFLSLKINRLNHVFVFEAYKDQFPTLIREIELSPTCKDKIGPLEIDRQH